MISHYPIGKCVYECTTAGRSGTIYHTTSRRVRGERPTAANRPVSHGAVPTDQNSIFVTESRRTAPRVRDKLQLALDESRYVRLTRRVRHDPGTTGGAKQARCDCWSDQRFMKVHGMGVCWCEGGRKDAPGWLRWHLTLITSPTRSLAREARKAIMYFGVKTERRDIQRQESPHDPANERRMVIVRGGKGKTKRARKEEDTRANNNTTHCKWNNEGVDDTDEEKRRIYTLEKYVTMPNRFERSQS